MFGVEIGPGLGLGPEFGLGSGLDLGAGIDLGPGIDFGPGIDLGPRVDFEPELDLDLDLDLRWKMERAQQNCELQSLAEYYSTTTSSPAIEAMSLHGSWIGISAMSQVGREGMLSFGFGLLRQR